MAYAHPLADLPWEDLPHGVRQKKARDGKQTVRIVEFPPGFAGEAACVRGHAGYVLSGSCSWDVGGRTVKVRAGDALTIPDHVPHRLFAGAESVALFLVEFHDGTRPV